MLRVRGRRAVTAWTVMTVAAGLLVVPGSARADVAPPESVDRERIVNLWQAGGTLVRPAAEQALLGTDDDVRAFLGRAQALQAVDDRLAVNQVLAVGGPAVRGEAQRALDSGRLAEFLTSGWQAATRVDQRVRVNQMMAVGGAQLRAAAQRALDADFASQLEASSVDPTPAGPLDTFIATGWRVPFELDQRLQVNRILTKAPANSNVHRLAQRALDARTVEALTDFLDSGYAVAASRDVEAGAIADLTAAAERSGAEAAQYNEVAKEESAKATAAAAAAKRSSQAALAAMVSAGDNAREAAIAANQAASAATQAAKAAGQAMAAAQAAVAASRVAARAAARAAAVAALTQQAANRANKAAADAAVNKDKSDNAKVLAKAAFDISQQARASAAAVEKTELMAAEAIKVADAANLSITNSNNALTEAEDALALARKTGVNVAVAMAAAERARNQAARANRAAAASIAFARAAVNAARTARLAANRAADDAMAASKAANEAAGHAGDATKAATAATNAANAATRAADDAVASANEAYKVYEAARAVDANRLAVAADEGAEAARTAKAAYEQYQRKSAWDAQEAAKRDAETKRLIAEARNPATPPAAAVAAARRAALALSAAGGPATNTEALAALGGSDDDVLAFVRTGLDRTTAQDDRATVTTIALTGTRGLHLAAEAALAGSDAQVGQFLRERTYPERSLEDRLTVNRVLSEATAAKNPVTMERAQQALDGDDRARREFLAAGQFVAANIDDRVEANQILKRSAPGTELHAAAQNALDGPPGMLDEFLSTGQYLAEQNDYDAQVHDAEMLTLLSRAAAAAMTAMQSSQEAQSVAFKARGKDTEAGEWAAKAILSAQEALKSANKADASADKAEKSAEKAVESAKLAADAAETANKAADSATRSAAAAQESYERAREDAAQAIDAAKRAETSARAAGKNADEARAWYESAYLRASGMIETEKREERNKQYYKCLQDAGPFDRFQRECGKVYQSDSLRTAKATLNKQFCNKFAKANDAYYQNCVADAFNPNFMLNRSMDIAQAGAIVVSRWGIFTMLGIGAAALAIGCAALCAAATGVLGGAEASMGIGGLFMAWAEGTLMAHVAGGIAGGFAGGRLMGELRGLLGKVRIPGIFQRITVPAKTTDANLARMMAGNLVQCSAPGKRLMPGSQVQPANRVSKAMEDVRVGKRAPATDPKPGSWVAGLQAWRNATDLASGTWLHTAAGTWVQTTALNPRTEHAAVHTVALKAKPCPPLALGIYDEGTKGWAQRNGWDHYLDDRWRQDPVSWRGPVKTDIHDFSKPLRVNMNGFTGGATPRELFLAAVRNGYGTSWKGTEREMAWIARSLHHGRDWNTVEFYLKGVKVEFDPPSNWWNFIGGTTGAAKAEREKWQKFLDLEEWAAQNGK